MNYVDFEDMKEYQEIRNNDEIVLFYGFNKESNKYEYHWACHNVKELIEAITPCTENVLLTFIPSEWVDEIKQIGFELYAKWNEYVMPDIEDVACDIVPEFIDIKEADQVSKLTISCSGQSRGFSGQTKEWVEQWIQGITPAVPDYVIDSTIIAKRIDNEIVGAICVGTYTNQNHEGLVVWIRELAVNPEYQGRGIGRQLLKQALVYGKLIGAKKAFLMADECNSSAIHLYESVGFIAKDEEGQIDMISLK
jgi:ribosomal protein S18 acetylase RimI-like enzyme